MHRLKKVGLNLVIHVSLRIIFLIKNSKQCFSIFFFSYSVNYYIYYNNFRSDAPVALFFKLAMEFLVSWIITWNDKLNFALFELYQHIIIDSVVAKLI